MASSPHTPGIEGPAFYAQPRLLHRRRSRDWWTLLHPPYTLCHLSFVVVGACLVGPVNSLTLWMTALAFFLAVGVGAHALDEFHGRPLRTEIPDWQLKAAALFGVGGAVAVGIVGAVTRNGYLGLCIVVGIFLALGYNLELFQGRLHTDVAFALGWGSFPVLTSYFAQHATISFAALVAAIFAALIAGTQRELSTPARNLRRRVLHVEGVQVNHDGSTAQITKEVQLQPLERALRLLCFASVAIAVSLACSRYHVL
ncbi:MAG: hypothetical protein ABSG09_09215 [Acidimicrobiales bacterium]